MTHQQFLLKKPFFAKIRHLMTLFLVYELLNPTFVISIIENICIFTNKVNSNQIYSPKTEIRGS